jgi:hypothetical protein
MLKWRQGNGVGMYALYLRGLVYGQVAGFCELDNEPSGSIKGGKVLDWLSDY